jgi:transcriptional regulator with XRE-family HTH domain
MREKSFCRNFGHALQAARRAAGLTQRELAERADIADKYLSRIEVGIATPSLFVAVRLAQLVNVGLDKLTSTTPGPPPAHLASILRMLDGRSAEEILRAGWILEALFRPTDSGVRATMPPK